MRSPLRLKITDNFLKNLGAFARKQPQFLLMLVGASWGITKLSFLKSSWRRSVVIEFDRVLSKSLGSAFACTIVISVISGIAIVSQAIYWMGFAGVAQNTGTVLAHVLIKEIAPILVSIILLGQAGMTMASELSSMSLNGQIRALKALGVDPFIQFVLPNTLALTVAAFTLGVIFSEFALVTGYLACWLEGMVGMPVWSFLYQVVLALDPIDYIGIPLKFLLSGFIIALSSSLSGLDINPNSDAAGVLPLGFFRGILSVLIMNGALDMLV